MPISIRVLKAKDNYLEIQGSYYTKPDKKGVVWFEFKKERVKKEIITHWIFDKKLTTWQRKELEKWAEGLIFLKSSFKV